MEHMPYTTLTLVHTQAAAQNKERANQVVSGLLVKAETQHGSETRSRYRDELIYENFNSINQLLISRSDTHFLKVDGVLSNSSWRFSGAAYSS